MRHLKPWQPVAALAGAVLLLLPLVGCRPATQEADEALYPPRDTSGENRDAVNELAGRYMTYFNEGDADGLASLFTADAVRLPPEAPSFRGHQSVLEAFQEQFADGDGGQITVRIDETEMAGDWAWVRGRWVVTTTVGEGEKLETLGKWLNIIRREPDGSWKIARNIWNTDAPTPGG